MKECNYYKTEDMILRELVQLTNKKKYILNQIEQLVVSKHASDQISKVDCFVKLN